MNTLLTSKKFIFRELQGIKEITASESLQKIVWESDNDFDNKDIIIAIQQAGGLVGGAFSEDTRMVGFILTIPSLELHVLHSHRLAVLPGFRNQHLGEKLKWFQRDWALARKIKSIQWTYDPLRTPNADLNIRRLGATANIYYEDYYGPMDGINSGIPSDRILAQWQIKSQRVIARCSSKHLQEQSFDIPCINTLKGISPNEERLDIQEPLVRMNIPDDIGTLITLDKDLALTWRLHIRRLLKSYFSRGYVITEFTRQNGPAYILENSL